MEWEAVNMTLCPTESAGDDCCMKDYSPFSNQHSDSSTSSSLYMESRESSDITFSVFLYFSVCIFFLHILNMLLQKRNVMNYKYNR